MNSATFLKSSCTKPLEVRAGEPNLKPLGRKALLSPTETHISQHSTGKIQSFTLINEAKKESVQPAGRQGLRLNIRVKQQDTLPGQVFLLQAIAQASRTFSARPPSVPLLRRSSRIRWLSEPSKENQINVLKKQNKNGKVYIMYSSNNVYEHSTIQNRNRLFLKKRNLFKNRYR